MKSKEHVRQLLFSNDSQEQVLFEGYLGKLVELSMTEGIVLEIKGTKGTVRVDLLEDELRKMLSEVNKK
jgi:hypothetical protein